MKKISYIYYVLPLVQKYCHDVLCNSFSFPVTYGEICRKIPRDGWQFESLQVLNTYSLLSINLFVQKQNTLNREEIIHNLNYGKITTPLFPTKIFHDFQLGGTML